MTYPKPCEWCGANHAAKCPFIKAVEYYPGGKLKRIEFMTPNDYPRLTSSQIGDLHARSGER